MPGNRGTMLNETAGTERPKRNNNPSANTTHAVRGQSVTLKSMTMVNVSGACGR